MRELEMQRQLCQVRPLLQCVAVCCSVLQFVVVCCSVFQFQYVAVCCILLQCVPVYDQFVEFEMQ